MSIFDHTNSSVTFDKLPLNRRLTLHKAIVEAFKELDSDDSPALEDSLILSGASSNQFDAKALQNRDRSRQSYIEQMNKIAANPDYDRISASKTADSGAPMVFVRGQTIPANQSGKKETITMSDGKGGTVKIPSIYAVVSADKLLASHDSSGNKVKGYGGANGIMALNNGRTAALKRAYKQSTANDYHAALMADVRSHGIPQSVIESVDSPVLVRVFSETSLAGIEDAGTASNISAGAELSDSEQASSDARRLDSSVVMKFQGGDINTSKNREFVRDFIDAMGGMAAAGKMVTDDGLISQHGIKRIQSALVSKAFDDKDIVESLSENPDDEIRSLGNVLKDISGRWAVMRESVENKQISESMDITKNLTDAIGMIRKSRKQGVKLSELVNQSDMFSGNTDPLTESLLRLMFRGDDFNRVRSADKISKALHSFLDKAMVSTSNEDMFGFKAEATDVLDQEKEKLLQSESAGSAQKGLFDSVEYFNEIIKRYNKEMLVFDSTEIGFRERLKINKAIVEAFEKLDSGELGFRERLAVNKEIAEGFAKLGGGKVASAESVIDEPVIKGPTNGDINKAFLSVVGGKAKEMILGSIAKHYGTSKDSILNELIDADAESILDYMVEPERSATSVLMQKHGFRKPNNEMVIPSGLSLQEETVDAPTEEPIQVEQTRQSSKEFYPDLPELSSSKRKKANAEAIMILDSVTNGKVKAEDLTEEQKIALAKYSGNGGGLTGRDGKTGSPYEYYTAKPLADAGWELLKGAGFSGGKVLDPCGGVGIFGATAPSNAVVDAIELDETSGGINKLLNSSIGNVTISPFEKVAAATPDGEYDAIITNIPFGDKSKRGDNFKHDPKYQKESLEGYFILRSLEKLKAGGTAVFISSSSFIQNVDYRKLREKASLLGEFVGAYRLPNAQDTGEKTKKGNAKELSTFAGADVTSDVLVFRRHTKANEEAIKKLFDSGDGEALQASNVMWQPFIDGKYFTTEGKRFILGENTTGMGQYGEVNRVVSDKPISETAKLMKPFDKSRIDFDVLSSAASEFELSIDETVGGHTYEEGETVFVGGQQMIYQDGEFIPVVNDTEDNEIAVRLEGLQSPLHVIQAKNAMSEVMEVVGALSARGRHTDIPEWLKKVKMSLNSIKEANQTEVFMLMTTALAARQVFDHHAGETYNFIDGYPLLSDKVKQYAPQYKLASVGGVVSDVKSKVKFLKSIYTLKDGFSEIWKGEGEELAAIELTEDAKKYDHLRYTEADENGFVGMARFKEMMPDIDPLTDDDWCISPDGKGVMNASDFYYGNYQDFLNRHASSNAADAVRARTGITDDDQLKVVQDKLKRQMSAASERLVRVDPKAMRYRLSTPFIAAERKVEFLNKYLKEASNGFFVEVDDKGRPAIGYKASTAGMADASNEDEFKEKKRNVARFYQYIAKGTLTTGSKAEDKFKSPKLEAARLERLKNTIASMEQQFDSWAKANPSVQRAIEKRLNDPNNLFFTEEDEGEPLDIPNINPEFIPHDYQNASIRRYARKMSGILGHDVGLGKTSQALLATQHIQSIGVKKKTLFVVPNSTLSNWRVETGITYQDNSDCLFIGLDIKRDKKGNEISATVKPANYGKDLLKVLSNKHRKIFIASSAFAMIPMKEETMQKYIDYIQTVDASFDADGSSKKTDAIKKDNRISSALDLGSKNESYPFFEDMGIDSLVFDEAHMFKNSKDVMEFKGGKQLSLAPKSNRGLDAQVKSWFVRGLSKKGDGVLSLTATPITNSPLEMYSMLSLSTGEEELNKRMGGIRGADEFMEAFCRIDQLESENLIGETTLSNVFTGLTNTPMLSTILHGTAHIRSAKDVDLKIPEYSDIPTSISLSEESKDQLSGLKSIYSVARDVMKDIDAEKPVDPEKWAIIQEVEKRTGEGVRVLAHPFNLINKMSKLILDEDLFMQSTIYRFDESQADLMDKAVKKFNDLKLKDERPEGRLTPASGEDRVILKTRKITKDDEDFIFETVHVKAYITGDKVALDTTDFDNQNRFLKIADSLGLDLDVSVSPKMAAFIENFKQEAASPKSPKDPERSPRIAKQIVFCDMVGMHNKIRIALSKVAGLPASKIKIVNGKSVSDPADMQDVQDGFNAESDENMFNVIIANEKAEVGINLQKGCQAIHHLTVGWTPDSLQQRNGRGVRQGNYVQQMNVYHYDADGTFDEYKRELVGVKSDWIGNLLDRKNKEDITVGGSMSREDMEDLVDATGDAEGVRRVIERKEARKIIAEKKAKRTAVLNSIASLKAHQDTLKDYSTFDSFINEKAMSALKTLQSMNVFRKNIDKAKADKDEISDLVSQAERINDDYMMSDLSKALLATLTPTAKKNLKPLIDENANVPEGLKSDLLIAIENKDAKLDGIIYRNTFKLESGEKSLNNAIEPIDQAVKFIYDEAEVSFKEFFDNDKYIAEVLKDKKLNVWNGGGYWKPTKYVQHREESGLKSLWTEELEVAQSMIDQLTEESKQSGVEAGVSDDRIDAVVDGSAEIIKNKIFGNGDFVESSDGKIYCMTGKNYRGGYRLIHVDPKSGMLGSEDEALFSTGKMITREDPEYAATVEFLASVDNELAAKNGLLSEVDWSSGNIGLRGNYNSKYSADVALKSNLDTTDYEFEDDGREVSKIELTEPYYPAVMVDTEGFSLLEKIKEKQSSVVSFADGIVKISKSAVVGGKMGDMPDSAKLSRLLSAAEEFNEKIPLTNEFIAAAGYSIYSFINDIAAASKARDGISVSVSGIIESAETPDQLRAEIATHLKATYSALEFPSDDEEVFSYIGKYSNFGYPTWEINSKVKALTTSQGGDAPAVSIGGYDDGYTTSADGQYICIALGNNMHKNKPIFNEFKDFFLYDSEKPLWGNAGRRKVSNPPRNSWVVRESSYIKYLQEHADIVAKYNITQV